MVRPHLALVLTIFTVQALVETDEMRCLKNGECVSVRLRNSVKGDDKWW